MIGNHVNKSSEKKSRVSPAIIILAVLLLIAVGVIVVLLTKGTGTAPLPNEAQQSQVSAKPAEKLTDSIDIPGYGYLSLKSGETEQDIAIPNPEQNFCWFRISLLLEDGTVLWTSALVAPGEASEPITLSAPLEKGEYENAMLKYECFSDAEGQNALNGAETKLTLKVN